MTQVALILFGVFFPIFSAIAGAIFAILFMASVWQLVREIFG